jgi:hypothetical protein
MIDIQNFIFDKKNRAHFNFGDELPHTQKHSKQSSFQLFDLCVWLAGQGRAGQASQVYIYIYINLKKVANNT